MNNKDETNKMLAHKDGAIAHMIFNNSDKHNAVSLAMWDRAEKILDDFESDDEVRVLIISGAGNKAFVSGADISEFGKERSAGEAVSDYNQRTSGVYARLENFSKPTIAMIDGYCIGGGLNLAAVCDLRFCSAKSKFGMPAARLGLGYPFHSIRRLINAIGVARAKDLMFSARHVDADEALNIGLVQKIVPEDKLQEFVSEYAAGIAQNAPLTIAGMKFLTGEVLKDAKDRDMARGDEMIKSCFASEDYLEGQQAFKEKRRPVFKGK